MADEAGRIGISQGTLGRRLAERGCLVSQDKKRLKCTVRKYVQGVRRDVLHVRLSLVLGQAPQAPSAPSGEQDVAALGSDGDDGAGDETARGLHPPPPGPVGPMGPVQGGETPSSGDERRGGLFGPAERGTDYD